METSTKKKKITVMQVIPLCGIILGAAFIYLGISKYGFWDEFKGPLPGFFPTLIAILMLSASALALFSSRKEETVSWTLDNWILPLSVIGIFLATWVIGLLLSLAIFVLVWLRKFEKCSWKTTLTVFAVVAVIVVGAFVLWLGVPFPKGIILTMLAN
ncbi:MAG: tripartite tricarboxylate transporter TctB family protein [Sphaerochaeta sp.]|jgi:hypothetical protein